MPCDYFFIIFLPGLTLAWRSNVSFGMDSGTSPSNLLRSEKYYRRAGQPRAAPPQPCRALLTLCCPDHTLASPAPSKLPPRECHNRVTWGRSYFFKAAKEGAGKFLFNFLAKGRCIIKSPFESAECCKRKYAHKLSVRTVRPVGSGERLTFLLYSNEPQSPR